MRLIDADKLIEEGWILERHRESNKLIGVKSIADVPTVEAKEVVYAKWVDTQPDYYGNIEEMLMYAVIAMIIIQQNMTICSSVQDAEQL